MIYPKRGLSVDIGNDKIKIAEYNRAKDKVKIKKVLIMDTPENSISDGVINEPLQLGEKIKAYLKENHVKSKDIVFTLSSSKIITREVELPDLPKKKLDTIIKLNAEEYFPVDLTEYTVDYTVIDKVIDDSEPKLKVSVIAALTTMVESYVELSNILGIKLGGLDYSGNSIVNFARHIKEESTYMLLDLGSDSTMVTIMNEGKLKFSRNLVYGTRVISNSIQNHFGVDYNEAMKISIEQSLLSHTPEGNDYLSSDVSAALNQILNGISRLVDYYSSRNKGGIEKIILVGGGTSIQGIDSYISEYFNIPARILSTEDIDMTGDATFEENKVFFANAIGAIYSDVNIMPLSIAALSKERSAKRLRVELGVLFLALACFAVYFPYSDMVKLEQQRDVLKAEIDQKQSVRAIVEEYQKIKNEAEFYQGIIDVSSSSTEIMAELLEAMEDVIPSQVYYLSLNNTEDGILISCISDTKLDAVQLQIKLKELEVNNEKIFSRVYIPNVTAVYESDESEEPDYMTFSIVCNYVVEEGNDE